MVLAGNIRLLRNEKQIDVMLGDLFTGRDNMLFEDK